MVTLTMFLKKIRLRTILISSFLFILFSHPENFMNGAQGIKDFLGNFLGLICATGLAVNAVIIRSAKKISLVPSAMVGKLMVILS